MFGITSSKNAFTLICVCLVVLFAINLPTTDGLPGKPVVCADSVMCSPSSEDKDKACSYYQNKRSHVKVSVELNNNIDDPLYYGFCVRVDKYAQLACVNCK
jgi:hypothetical protein